MTDIPVFDFTMPNRRQSQDVFDTAYQAFIDRLPLFVTAMNQQAAELTALANVTVYSPFATYDIPATVYASDGLTYRCKGYNVSGDNPVGSVSGNWVAIVLRAQDLEAIAHNDVIGGVISKTADKTLSISACRCMDSTRQVPLQTTEIKTLVVTTSANAIYHIYLVRLVATGATEFKAYATHDAVADDGLINAYRWRGCLPVDGSGNFYDFYHEPGQDIIYFFPGVVVESGFAFGNRTLDLSPYDPSFIPKIALTFPQAGNETNMSSFAVYLDAARTISAGQVSEGNTGRGVPTFLHVNPPAATLYATFSQNPYTSVSTASWGYEAIQLKV